MGNWKVIQPVAATNLALNPSAEIATPANWAAFNSATITRDTSRARFGVYCYKVVPGGVGRGIILSTAALGNAIHYVTFYVSGTIAGTISVSLNAGANENTATVIGGATGGWVRYGASIPAAQCNGSVVTRLTNSANETWYTDAIQVEQSTYYTTYIDGDRVWNTGGQRGLYLWTGHRHASTSTRDAQERGGGRELDLETDYGVRVLQNPGAGMPPLVHNLQGLALQPGAAFENTKVLPRMLWLSVEMHDTVYSELHGLRKALINLVKPDGVRGAQPFILGYAGANSGKTVYCAFRYADGLGIGRVQGGATFIENQIPITLLAVDPYWWEDNRETSSLGFINTLTAVNRVIGRVNGLWGKLGTGFNNTCRCSAYDPKTGRVYFGGEFTTANGVTVNGICYWNPTTATFTAMDAGVNATVHAIAIAPNGDVWIGGEFSTVGSGAAATKGLAKWSLSGSSWSVQTNTSTTFTSIYALVVDNAGNLYGGGAFTNYSGNANCDNIFKYTAAGAFAALGTGLNSTCLGLARWLESSATSAAQRIYVAGQFTTGNGVTINYSGYWNGITFVAIGGGLNAISTAVVVAQNGNVYYGGTFTASGAPAVSMSLVGMFNGTSWEPLSNGFTGTDISALYFGPDGLLYVAGDYTAFGPFTTSWPAVWNGSNWQQLDISSVASTLLAYTFLVLPNDNLYIGSTLNNATLIVGSPTTNIVSTNTVSVFPTFTIFGPTTANTILLQAIVNLSTWQILRFDLTINQEEGIGIDLTPGQKLVASFWRGVLPGQPLPTSDFANFKLQPTRADGAATNTIVTFVKGTTTGALFLMHWVPAHWSVDGAAA